MKAKLRLCKSVLSDAVYVGRLNKAGDTFLDKQDVTNDFIGAVIARWNGFTETIVSADGKKYEITVDEI